MSMTYFVTSLTMPDLQSRDIITCGKLCKHFLWHQLLWHQLALASCEFHSIKHLLDSDLMIYVKKILITVFYLLFQSRFYQIHRFYPYCSFKTQQLMTSQIGQYGVCNTKMVVVGWVADSDLLGHYGSHPRPQVADRGTPSRKGQEGSTG